MFKPCFSMFQSLDLAWRHSVGLLFSLVVVVALAFWGQSVDATVPPLASLLVAVFSIILPLSVGFMCRRFYRKKYSYTMLVFGAAFFSVTGLELCYFVLHHQSFLSPLPHSSNIVAVWAGLITRGFLAAVLLICGILLSRYERLANGGKMSISVLAIGSIIFAVLSVAFLYVVSLPFMQVTLDHLRSVLELLVTVIFAVAIAYFGWRGRWLHCTLECGVFACVCIQFILYFWPVSPELGANSLAVFCLALIKLLSYLVVSIAIYIELKAPAPMSDVEREHRREDRLIRLMERARGKNHSWFTRTKSSISTYVTLLSGCLVVAGVLVTYLIFYFSFVSSLELERKQQLSLHNAIQVERLDREIDHAYEEIQHFAEPALLSGFIQQQYVDGQFLNIEPAFWKSRIENDIRHELKREKALVAVHLVVVAQGQQIDYLSVGKQYGQALPKTLLKKAELAPNAAHAQTIRQANQGFWYLAHGVQHHSGEVAAIWLFQYQLDELFKSSQRNSAYGLLGEANQHSGGPLLVFDVNGERLWRSKLNKNDSGRFQASEYQRLKELIDSPVKDVANQVITFGSYILSIQRLSYFVNNKKEYLDLVQIANYQDTIAASQMAAKQALLAATVVTGLMVLVGWFFAHTIVSPLRYITNATLLFGERNIRVTLPEKSHDEVGVLAKAIGQMTEKVDARTDQLNNEIAQHQKSQKQLSLAQKEAEAASLAKSDFLAMMSHEIRTPLNGIIGMAQLLSASSLSAEQTEHLNTIRLSGKALLVIVNDVLDFSKVEAGKMELRLDAFNLKLTLLEVVKLFSPQAKSKHIKLQLDYPEHLPAVFIGDQGRVQQIFINLVSNAIKFTEVGTVNLSVEYYPDASIEETVVLRVTDSGIGIAEEAIADLFTPFAQADNSTTRRYGGTGLGLAICHRIVSLMNGDISVQSGLGVGSEFRVSLPMQSVEDDVLSVGTKEEREHIELSRLSGHVLLVEDTLVNQRVASHMLNSFGLKVMIARDGHEAIDLFKRWGSKLSLILMDCLMPDMDGYEATTVIRELENHAQRIPIVALTASVSVEAKQACFDAGMDDFVTKPFDRVGLYVCLRKWLSARNERGRKLSSHQMPAPKDYQYITAADLDNLSSSMGEEFESLLHEYKKGAEAMIVELTQALNAERYQEAIRLAHGLKSSSSYFGASRLQHLCFQLEEGLKIKPITQEILGLAAALEANLQETMLEIEQHMRLYSK
ncbi:ATP-binding protein [Agarivorans sp. 1_MG-2023]|uniref:ATP-binding protein n=1 Tax=Agarivorans sp. 1_MG-2023 TaxID=3062634 RepID=UPI0026E3A6C2|nr:ATP-binding protein [Agarivorans sp. 1_MG-2023]MDO6765002.1 ATP-binding protein [Agarivorans sp. 1_MG-2023]